MSKKKSSKKTKPSAQTPEEKAFRQIIVNAGNLGWSISFNNEDELAPVNYLILGTPREVDRITDLIEADNKKKAKKASKK